jgi:hypothetical protein
MSNVVGKRAGQAGERARQASGPPRKHTKKPTFSNSISPQRLERFSRKFTIELFVYIRKES